MVRVNGDYVPDGAGGFLRAEGTDELLQRVLWKLSIPRGSFPFLPDLGSRLHLLAREKPSAREAPGPAVCGPGPARRRKGTCPVTEVELGGRRNAGKGHELEWRGETLTADGGGLGA